MKFDFLLILSIASLLIVGLLVLFSVSAQLSIRTTGNVFSYVEHQLLVGVLPGLALGLTLFFIDLEKIKKLSLYFFLFSLFLTALVFIPKLGVEAGGARRWLKIGSFVFQPSELLKLSLPLYLAVWLEKKKSEEVITTVIFSTIVVLVCFVLMLQPDMSTAVIVLAYSFLVYFLSDAPLSHVLALVGVGAILFILLIIISPYRMKRFLVFFKPNYDPTGAGYQAKQSKIAIGSGGIFGRGLGLSVYKSGEIPNVISDSVFSVLAEEMGVIGSLSLVVLFLLFLFRVASLAKKKDGFVFMLTPALAGGIVSQAFLNIAAMTGIIPLTGVPLPFISYGGSHLLVEVLTCSLIVKLLQNE